MGQPIVDRARLLERVAGDRALLEKIIDMYTGGRPALLRELEVAIESGDAAAVHRKAHKLKGTFGALAAETATAAAERILALAGAGDLSELPAAYEALAREAEKVERELREIESESWGEPVGAR